MWSAGGHYLQSVASFFRKEVISMSDDWDSGAADDQGNNGSSPDGGSGTDNDGGNGE